MTENSKIEWCDATWQVTHGCRAIAPGCANCYAIRDAHRMAGHPNPKISGPRHGLTRRRDNGLGRTVWTGVVRTAPENLAIPLRWKKPKRIFVNSNSDLFHEAVPFEFIAAVYGVMAACPQHRFVILTKRPKRMREFFEWWSNHLPNTLPEALTGNRLRYAWASVTDLAPATLPHIDAEFPLPNVIHGYSAANQADLDTGIADLLATPSALRCLSLEPLIGPVVFSNVLERFVESGIEYGRGFNATRVGHVERGIDWIITGGESGPGARPCDIEWIRRIVEQCKAAGVPCFVKQVGSNPTPNRPMRLPAYSATTGKPLKGWYGDGHETIQDRKGANPSEWPADLRVRQWPEVTRG